MPPPLAKCPVIGPSNHGPDYDVLKQKLIVEATLTESCIPVRFRGFIWILRTSKEIYCRTLDEPKLDPAAPIWHLY
jgi:hypothetical protein